MNRVTVAYLLDKHGPSSTSANIREKSGITVKGTPISGHLSTLVREGYAKKKNAVGGNVYTLNKKGQTWLESNIDDVESVEDINARDYSKGAKKQTVARLPSSAAVESALDGVAAVIEENERYRAAIEGTYLQLGQLLGR